MGSAGIELATNGRIPGPCAGGVHLHAGPRRTDRAHRREGQAAHGLLQRAGQDQRPCHSQPRRPGDARCGPIPVRECPRRGLATENRPARRLLVSPAPEPRLPLPRCPRQPSVGSEPDREGATSSPVSRDSAAISAALPRTVAANTRFASRSASFIRLTPSGPRRRSPSTSITANEAVPPSLRSACTSPRPSSSGHGPITVRRSRSPTASACPASIASRSWRALERASAWTAWGCRARQARVAAVMPRSATGSLGPGWAERADRKRLAGAPRLVPGVSTMPCEPWRHRGAPHRLRYASANALPGSTAAGGRRRIAASVEETGLAWPCSEHAQDGATAPSGTSRPAGRGAATRPPTAPGRRRRSSSCATRPLSTPAATSGSSASPSRFGGVSSRSSSGRPAAASRR